AAPDEVVGVEPPRADADDGDAQRWDQRRHPVVRADDELRLLAVRLLPVGDGAPALPGVRLAPDVDREPDADDAGGGHAGQLPGLPGSSPTHSYSPGCQVPSTYAWTPATQAMLCG